MPQVPVAKNGKLKVHQAPPRREHVTSPVTFLVVYPFQNLLVQVIVVEVRPGSSSPVTFVYEHRPAIRLTAGQVAALQLTKSVQSTIEPLTSSQTIDHLSGKTA